MQRLSFQPTNLNCGRHCCCWYSSSKQIFLPSTSNRNHSDNREIAMSPFFFVAFLASSTGFLIPPPIQNNNNYSYNNTKEYTIPSSGKFLLFKYCNNTAAACLLCCNLCRSLYVIIHKENNVSYSFKSDDKASRNNIFHFSPAV